MTLPLRTRGPRSRRPLLPLLIAFVALGCQDATGPSEPYAAEREQLMQAWAKWRANGPRDYTYTFRFICFCPAEYVNPTRVTVKLGAVTSAEGVADTIPRDRIHYDTVDELFARLLNATSQGVPVFDAEYDPVLGFPIRGFIDESLYLHDNEFIFRASDVRPLN